MRDKLIALISGSSDEKLEIPYISDGGATALADYLIANGIIVPPCKIGDTVYFIHQGCVLSGVVQSYENGHYVEAWVASCRLNFDILNKSVFLTQEEAEAELERRNG